MVASYTQLLEKRYKGNLDADADEFIAYAVDGALRMQDMIESLLYYSRVGSRVKPLQLVESESAFEQAVADLKFAIDESGAEITHDPLPQVMADKFRTHIRYIPAPARERRVSRNRHGPVDLQEDYGASRRAHLGGVSAWRGLHILCHNTERK